MVSRNPRARTRRFSWVTHFRREGQCEGDDERKTLGNCDDDEGDCDDEDLDEHDTFMVGRPHRIVRAQLNEEPHHESREEEAGETDDDFVDVDVCFHTTTNVVSSSSLRVWN